MYKALTEKLNANDVSYVLPDMLKKINSENGIILNVSIFPAIYIGNYREAAGSITIIYKVDQ